MSARRSASDLNAAVLGSSVPSERHRAQLALFDAQIAMVDHLLAGLPAAPEPQGNDIERAFADGTLKVLVDERATSVPPYLNVVGYTPRRSTAGTPLDAMLRFVHVMSRAAGGEIRGYALIEGRAYLRLPNYTGAWPELDAAVAARLDCEVVS